MKETTYIEMEYGELEKLIKQTYGHTYEFVCCEELGNDCEKSFDVEVEALDEWEQGDMDEFIASGKIENWRTCTILKHMVNTGVLKPGKYLISVSW